MRWRKLRARRGIGIDLAQHWPQTSLGVIILEVRFGVRKADPQLCTDVRCGSFAARPAMLTREAMGERKQIEALLGETRKLLQEMG